MKHLRPLTRPVARAQDGEGNGAVLLFILDALIALLRFVGSVKG